MNPIFSSSGVYQKQENKKYFIAQVPNLSDAENWKKILSRDNSPIIFRGNERATDNFDESWFLYGDSDDGRTISEFQEKWGGFSYIISTSRNHKKEKTKNGKTIPACERFHFFFPLSEPIKNPDLYKAALYSMHRQDGHCDPAAKDAARFLFGNRDTEIIVNIGKNFVPDFSCYEEEESVEPHAVESESVAIKSMPGEWGNPVWVSELKYLLMTMAKRDCFRDRTAMWIPLASAIKDAEKQDPKSWSIDDFVALSDHDTVADIEEARRVYKTLKNNGKIRRDWLTSRREVDQGFFTAEMVRNAKEKPEGPFERKNAWAEFSDELIAQDVVANHAGTLRFLEDDQLWMVYNSRFWVPNERAAFEKVHGVLIDQSNHVSELISEAATASERTKLKTVTTQLHSHSKLREVKKYAGEFLRAKSTDFDSMRDYFPAANGLVYLKHGTVMPNAPEHLFTFGSEYNYDKNATCPKFLAWMKKIMLDRESIVDWLQVYFGYCLSGQITEHIFPVFYGSGGNGKGTLIRTVSAIMGPRAARTMDVKVLLSSERTGNEGQYAFASLQGARFVTASEPKKTSTLDTGLIKSITGGDVVACRQIYGRAKEYLPTWKIMLQANHKPEIPEQDAGIWRRVKLIPFDFSVKEEDKIRGLEDEFLSEEAPGIFAWMVRGAMYWYANGFPYCEAVESETNEYKDEEDTIKAFLDDCISIYGPNDPHYDSRLHNSDMTVAFVKWSNESRDRKLSRKTLAKELQRYGIERARYRPDGGGNAVWFYLHCSLKNAIYEGREADF